MPFNLANGLGQPMSPAHAEHEEACARTRTVLSMGAAHTPASPLISR